jgi:hypothetical protein
MSHFTYKLVLTLGQLDSTPQTRGGQLLLGHACVPTIQLQHVNTPPNMALSYSDKEAGIQEALGAWQTNPERSIADIAREFGVSLWALRRRLHGVPSKIEGSGQNKKLFRMGNRLLYSISSYWKILE